MAHEHEFEDMRGDEWPAHLTSLQRAAQLAWETFAELDDLLDTVHGAGEDKNPGKRGPVAELAGRGYALLRDLRAEGMRQLAEWEKTEEKTSMQYTGYTINLDPMTGEMFGLDWISAEERATIDENASCAAYDALLEQQLRAAYPGAVVHWITAYDRIQHGRPGVLWTGSDEALENAVGDEVSIWQGVCEVSTRLFDDGNLWMVEKPATSTSAD